jgi:hypothetical protein
LTDGDLEAVDGEAARLLGLLQEKYGYARKRAERELLAFLDESLRGGSPQPSLPREARGPVRQGMPASR